MSIKYIQDDNGNFYTDENGNLLTVDVSGEGGATTPLFSEWTTGTSGNLYLPSAGLYEIKVVVLEYDEPRTMTFFVDWEVSSYSYSQSTLYEVRRNDSSSIIMVDDTGLIEYYNNDNNSDKVQSISYRKLNENVGGGGGTPLVEITYDELKALRDGGQLVAGQKYRITDYNCTTTQENTTSAMHQFDIIVEALSNNTLSENASAIQHAGDGSGDGSGDGGGSPQFKPEVLADSEGTLVEGAVVPSYYVFEDAYEMNGTKEDYKSQDTFIAYTYMENNDGVVVPVIYKTDADGVINAPEEYDYPDREDTFFYEGTMEVDGVVYDKWRKITLTDDSELTWDSDGKVWALTNVVVTSGGSVSNPYFANCKLSAWEIKYSLDNDKTRFWWALDGQAIVNLESFFSNGTPLTRQTVFDGSCPAEGYSEYQYAWGTKADVEDDDAWSFVYSKNETLTNGESVYNGNAGGLEVAEVVSGKGVIYYMKDEYDNECPYDFKNIQFDREGTYYYTFSWVDENDAVKDLSIVGNTELYNDEGRVTGCFGNKMGILSAYEFGFSIDTPTNLATALNDNVFISTYSYEDGFFYGCIANTIGDNSRTNTFGGNSISNTIGNYCVANTFGDDSRYNTFGGYCGNNTIGDSCRYNTFGKFCRLNIFGDDCHKNIVDDGVQRAQPQTTGTGTMQGIHIHFGVSGQFTVARGVSYTQDVRRASDVTITV